MHSNQEAQLRAQAVETFTAIRIPSTDQEQSLGSTTGSKGTSGLMTESINVQYVGFESKMLAREYRFVVRGSANQISEYTLTIDNESFDSRHVRFQDAAEICSLRLHRELAAFGNDPPRTHYAIGLADLDDYRRTHSPKAVIKSPEPKSQDDL
jgi:hypothetical protein